MTEFSVGQEVTTPRGGMAAIVEYVGDGGVRDSVLATTDGKPIVGGRVWCAHAAPEAMYFEYLAGPARGVHGWYDGNPDCRAVFQVG